MPNYRITQKLIKTKQHFNNDNFCIDIRATIGLFAQFNWALYILMHCKEHNKKPSIRLSGHFYTDKKKNYLTKILQEKQPSIKRGVRYSKIKHMKQLPIRQNFSKNLDFKTAHAVFFEYYDIHPDVEQYVKKFAAENFDQNTLAVHLRGTDKIEEAERKPDEIIIEKLKESIKKNGSTSIFLATDEEQYVTLIKEHFKDIKIIVHPGMHRSVNGEAIHRSKRRSKQKRDKSQLAVEAMIDCLLLAQCSTLIKTASFLSGWACVFNPDIKVSLLNKPNKEKLWFPDKAIV